MGVCVCVCVPIVSAHRCVVCAVEAPCRPGCGGLRYCSGFNARPVDTFRACHSLADAAARSTVQLWRTTGTIALPAFNLTVHVKGTSRLHTLVH